MGEASGRGALGTKLQHEEKLGVRRESWGQCNVTAGGSAALNAII